MNSQCKCSLCNMHIHSMYSSLDGYIRIPELVDKAIEFNQPAVAITDHGFLGGLLELFKTCEDRNKTAKKQIIKPIIGMELYIVNDRTKKVKGESNKHLLVHARNQTGYKNLLKLHYEGYATGATFVYDRLVPRIDRTLLTRESCKGLTATTGCLVSEINQLLKEDKWQEAIKLGEYYKSIFDELFAELQPSYLIGEVQAEANDKITKLAEMLDISLICTTDSHYLTEEERDEHQLILAIQSKKDIFDENRFKFEATPFLSTEQMLTHFDEKVIANTQKMAEMCEYPDYLRFDKHGYRLPKYPITTLPEYEKWKEQKQFEKEDESFKYCMYLVQENWKKKLQHTQEDPELDKKYRERFETEISVIKKMGFIDYFLIVQDFVGWCKKNDIMTGAGRGSVGGSLLAYLLGITKLDPIKYDLLFSRFLNADRISLPDIDMDIDKARRDEVKEYLATKYGRDHVASIATFNTMKVRACVKDIVRSLKLGGDRATSFEIADKINKTLEDQEDNISYEEAMKIPEFAKLIAEYPQVGKYAENFEGLVRQTGIHAAGVIIGAEPLTDTIPLMVDKNGVIATAYDGATLEKDGFLKMDLLGLKNLTIITNCFENIQKVRGQKFKGFHMKGIGLVYDEPDALFEQRLSQASPGKQMASRAYKMMRDGRTMGTFQTESQTMRELLKGIQVNNIEDIAAVLALCRPGPLASGETAEYGKRKRSGEDRDEWYLHPSLKPILKSTYSLIIFQEQCMKIAVQCAGFTEAEADSLRRGIGKKDAKLLSKFENQFIEGCQKVSGMSLDIAKKVYGAVYKFSNYGFNASHAIGYAITSYQTAYLKANHPAEFTGALLSNEADQLKVNSYIREALNSGLKIKPVNINKSTMRYEVEDAKTIRRNLTTLKNVGARAVEDILSKRPYNNMVDFLARTDSKRVTSRVIEALIKAGAFDGAFAEEKVQRKTYYDFYDDCRKKIKRFVKRTRENDEKAGVPVRTDEEIMKDFPPYNWNNPVNVRSRDGKEYETPVQRFSKDPREEWRASEIVAFESEIYGAPVSFNIFDFHHGAEETFKTGYNPIYRFNQSLDEYNDTDKVYMMFIVQGCVKRSPYKKDPKKFIRRFQIEDRTGEGIITLFHKTYEDDPSAWKNGNTIIARCAVNVFMDRKGLVVDKILKNCGGIDGTM